jgi:hypothetical protein
VCSVTRAKSVCTESKHEYRSLRKEQGRMMELAIEKPTRANRITSKSATKISAGHLLLLAEAGRVAEEDAAIAAEDILTQAEEANVLDPVG